MKNSVQLLHVPVMYGKGIHVAEFISIIWTEYFVSGDCWFDFHEFGMNNVEVSAEAVMSSEHFGGTYELVGRKCTASCILIRSRV
jgi:hypothetical protein